MAESEFGERVRRQARIRRFVTPAAGQSVPSELVLVGGLSSGSKPNFWSSWTSVRVSGSNIFRHNGLQRLTEAVSKQLAKQVCLR